MMREFKIPKGYWICSSCAHEYGGEWPKGHVATCAMLKCDTCNTKTACAPIVDYDWPDRTFTRKCKLNRD